MSSGRQEKDWLASSSLELRVRSAGEAGGGLPFLLNKAASPHFPQKEPQARALMDLGMNGAQPEWPLILGFDFSLASRTGVGIVLIT